VNGGAREYIFWLISDRARDERFQRTVTWVAFVAIAVLLLVFPNLWWQMSRVDAGLLACLPGGIVAASMLVVGTGWGLMHLVNQRRIRPIKCDRALEFGR
jgi:hypothetical protein